MHVRSFTAVWSLLVLAAVGSVNAAEEPAKGKKNPVEQQVQRRFELPEEISLTDAQRSALEAVKQEYAGKVKEAIEKRESQLTSEQKQARQAAQKEARQAGKKQKEILEVGFAALNLSGEQLKQYTTAEDAVKKLDEEIRGKIAAILTDEQKENLKKARKAAA